MTTIAELFALAVQLQQTGQLDRAEQLYRQILTIDPGHADTHHKVGNMLLRQRQFDQAIGHYRQALANRSGDAQTHCNLGIALAAQNKLNEAVHHFREALRLDPNFAAAYNNLGTALRSLGQWDEAAFCFREALRLDPGFGDAHYNLGNTFKDHGQLDEAVSQYRQALRINPHNANVHNNLASVLQTQHQLDEAVGHYQEALRLSPSHAEAHRNLGTALQCLGRLDQAGMHYEQALRLRPAFPEAHHDRALLWLLNGDFVRGWPEYEWRWRLPGAGRRSFVQPLWDGSPLDGRTILLHAEQGLGDTIHFIRYAPLVKQRGGRVIVECQHPLLRLLANAVGIDQLVARGSQLPRFDVQAPLTSLPGVFGTCYENMPNAVPFLDAHPDLVEHWRHELQWQRGFKIGIAWQGNPAYRYDCYRSIPLTSFRPLSKFEGVRLITLQKGSGVEQIHGLPTCFSLLDLGDRLDERSGAFMDTAAVMKNVDLVICSDSAIAHLAGALGVAVWLAVPAVPDWRWLLERQNSPWYPTMRLFRQKYPGQWDDVFERMAAELAAYQPEASARA